MAEFDSAAKFLSLSQDQTAFIKEPRLSLRLKFPVQMDNGHIKIFKAYHTVHSIVRGPSIGGIQFRPKIDLGMIEALAFWSTHRCALMNIPFGGCAGGVEVDQADHSAAEIERIARRYVSELSSIIGQDNDLLTADIGTNQQIMCYFMDTYSMHSGDFSPSVALGKPVGLGGIGTSVPPVVIGADICIRKAAKHIGLEIKDSRVVIQGFGKVGLNLAKLLFEAGAKVIGISDITGAYVNPNGINITEAIWHHQSYGILDGLENEIDVEKLGNPLQLFELQTDILVPAAVEMQITKANMSKVNAKIIAEIAHDPVSPEADRALHDRGVIVIPDILCNSGGVTGHYVEWVQNRTGYYWTEERNRDEISKIVDKAMDEVIEISSNEKIPLRLAAAVIAVKRISKAASLRGVYA